MIPSDVFLYKRIALRQTSFGFGRGPAAGVLLLEQGVNQGSAYNSGIVAHLGFDHLGIVAHMTTIAVFVDIILKGRQ